jgi:hypothetical protein
VDIEDWLDPPEQHRELWWEGELEFIHPMSEQSDPPRPGSLGRWAGWREWVMDDPASDLAGRR